MTRPAPRRAGRDDRGVAIVWSLALCSVLMLVGAFGAVVAGQAGLRMRAGTVADLAAIYGARAADDPCAAAAEVASANGLALTACNRDGPDLLVTVAAEPPEQMRRLLAVIGGSPRGVTASARAGPP